MAETVSQFFTELGGKIDPKKVSGINATYQFNITGPGGGEWNVKLADGAAAVAPGAADNPNITLTASDENWLSIVNGKTSGQTAFLTGKLKIQGDMGLAMKLQNVIS